MNPSSFGARVARLRDLADLERPDAAMLAGLHRNVLYKAETSGLDNPEANTARAVARLFGVSLDWLLTGEGEAPDADTVRAAVEAARARAAATATPDPEAA